MDEPVADIGCRRTGREAEDGDAEDQTGGDGDALADVPGSRGPEDGAGGEEDDNGHDVVLDPGGDPDVP